MTANKTETRALEALRVAAAERVAAGQTWGMNRIGTKAQRRVAAKLCDRDGWTQLTVAKAIGVTRSVVRQWRDECGCEPRTYERSA